MNFLCNTKNSEIQYLQSGSARDSMGKVSVAYYTDVFHLYISCSDTNVARCIFHISNDFIKTLNYFDRLFRLFVRYVQRRSGRMYVQWTRAIRNSMRTPSPTETAQPTAPSNLQNTHGATCASLISRTVTRRMGIKIRPAGNKQFRRFDQEIARGSSGGACKQLARILPRSST